MKKKENYLKIEPLGLINPKVTNIIEVKLPNNENISKRENKA